MGEAHKRHAINSLKGSSTLQTVKDKPTHTLKRTHWHTYRHNKTPNVHEHALTPALFPLLILISLISNHIFLQHLTVSFCTPKQWDSQSHTQAHRHIHKVYWTLRVRADTPWCQSLSSLYLGPITNRVVLFTFVFLAVSASSFWTFSVPVIWARILKDLDWVVPVRGRQSSVSSIMRFLLASAWLGTW